jgi:hypothetical protein
MNIFLKSEHGRNDTVVLSMGVDDPSRR